jgi:hypothetical protein
MVPFRRLGIAAILAALAMAAGCRRPGLAELDERERHDPAVQAAWTAAESNDVARAESLYDAILRDKPDLARAHLDLAMILMDADEKPVKAIHHFMRYLELRPGTEKRDLITQNIRKLTVLIGGKASKSRIGQLELQVAILQAENDSLKRSLGIAGLPLANPVAAAPPAAGPLAGSPAPAPAPGPRAYTVRAGDSLTRIAQAMYGDAEKADRIYEANRGKLKSRNALQAGQVLVIPP